MSLSAIQHLKKYAFKYCFSLLLVYYNVSWITQNKNGRYAINFRLLIQKVWNNWWFAMFFIGSFEYTFFWFSSFYWNILCFCFCLSCTIFYPFIYSLLLYLIWFWWWWNLNIKFFCLSWYLTWFYSFQISLVNWQYTHFFVE